VFWFLIEFSDLIFQSDPFQLARYDARAFFQKNSRLDSVTNAKWIQGCYGRRTFWRLKESVILNSGSGPIGPVNFFVYFLRLFLGRPEHWEHCTICHNHLTFIVYAGAIRDTGIPSMIRGCDAVLLLDFAG
jgi:hypothetical protein